MTTLTISPVIHLEERSVYGRFNYYVAGEHADAINRLTKKRTVDASDVAALECLGFKVRVAGRPEMPATEAMR